MKTSIKVPVRIATVKATGLSYKVKYIDFQGAGVVHCWGEVTAFRAKLLRSSGALFSSSVKHGENKLFSLEEVTITEETPSAQMLTSQFEQAKRFR